MNTLTHEERCAVVRCLVDGCSIRATTRITGVAKNTIQKLTRELGEAVQQYHDNVVRRVKSQRVQCDEVWCFCYAKEKNLPDEMRGQPGVGSMWTWTALDADTKLMISWKLGARDAATAHAFMRDVQERLANRVQLTTDANRVYLEAVADYFAEVDFAIYRSSTALSRPAPRHATVPPSAMERKRRSSWGIPDPDHISTSYMERQNLNIRMQNRRSPG